MNPTRSITISLVLAPSTGEDHGTPRTSRSRTERRVERVVSLERRLRNGPGRDTISAEATSPSGEVCRAP
jgi:hypothetical protein